MTSATEQALSGLRDLTMIKWYVIPLLAIVFYIYTTGNKRGAPDQKLGCRPGRSDYFWRRFL